MSALQEVVQQLEDILKTSNQYGPFVCLDPSPPVCVLPFDKNGQCSTNDSDGIQKRIEASPELLLYDRDTFISQGLGPDQQDDNDEVIFARSVGEEGLGETVESNNKSNVLDEFSSCYGLGRCTHVEEDQEEAEMAIETFERPQMGIGSQGSDGISSDILHQVALAFQVQEGGTVMADSPVPSTCEVDPQRTVDQLSSADPLLQNYSEGNVQVVKTGVDGEDGKETVEERAGQPTKRKRGRPRKPVDPNSAVPKIKRPRGRPRKNPYANVKSDVPVPSAAVDHCFNLSNIRKNQDLSSKDLFNGGSSHSDEVNLDMFINSQEGVQNDIDRSVIATHLCTISNEYCDDSMSTSYLRAARPNDTSRNELNLEINAPHELNNHLTTGVSIHSEGAETEAETTPENSVWALNGLDSQECHGSTTDNMWNEGVPKVQVEEGEKVSEDSNIPSTSEVNPQNKIKQISSTVASFQNGIRSSVQLEKCQHTTRKRRKERNKTKKPGQKCATNLELDALSISDDMMGTCKFSTLSEAISVQDLRKGSNRNKDLFNDCSSVIDEDRVGVSGDIQQEGQNSLMKECENINSEADRPDELHNFHGNNGSAHHRVETEEAQTATENGKVDSQRTIEHVSTTDPLLQNCSEGNVQVVKNGVDEEDGKETVKVEAVQPTKRKRGRPRKPIDPSSIIQKIKRQRGRPRKITATNVEIGPVSLSKDHVDKCYPPSHANGIHNSNEDSDVNKVVSNECSMAPTCTLATSGDTEKRTKTSNNGQNGHSSYEVSNTKTGNENNGANQEEVSREKKNGSHHPRYHPKKSDVWEKETAAVKNAKRKSVKNQEVPKLKLHRKAREITGHCSKKQRLSRGDAQGVIPSQNYLTGQERSFVTSSLLNAHCENAGESHSIGRRTPPVQTPEKEKESMIQIRTVLSDNEQKSSFMQMRDDEIVSKPEQCEVAEGISMSEALPTETAIPKHVDASFVTNASTCNVLLNTSEKNATFQTLHKVGQSMKRPRGRRRKKTKKDRDMTVKYTGCDNQSGCDNKEASVPPSDDNMLATACLKGSDLLGHKTLSPLCECNGDAKGPHKISCSFNQKGEPDVTTTAEPIITTSGNERMKGDMLQEIPEQSSLDNRVSVKCGRGRPKKDTSKKDASKKKEINTTHHPRTEPGDMLPHSGQSQMIDVADILIPSSSLPTSSLTTTDTVKTTVNTKETTDEVLVITSNERSDTSGNDHSEVTKESEQDKVLYLVQYQSCPPVKESEVSMGNHLPDHQPPTLETLPVSQQKGALPVKCSRGRQRHLPHHREKVHKVCHASGQIGNAVCEDASTKIVGEKTNISVDTCRNIKKRGRGRPRKNRLVKDAIHYVDSSRGFQNRCSAVRRKLRKKIADQVHNKSPDKEQRIATPCPSLPEIASTGGGKSPQMNHSSSIQDDSVHKETDIKLGLQSDITESLDGERLLKIKPQCALNDVDHGALSRKGKLECLTQETEVITGDSKSASICQSFARISQKPVTTHRVIPVVCSSETEMHYSKELKLKGNQGTAHTYSRRFGTDVPSTESGFKALPLQKDHHRSMLLRNGCMKKPAVCIKKLPKRLISGPFNLDDHTRLAQFLHYREKHAKTMKMKNKHVSTQSISAYAHQSSPVKSTTPLSSGGRVITPYVFDHAQSYMPTSPQKTVKLRYGEQNGQTTQTRDGTGKYLPPIKTFLKHPPISFSSMKTSEKGKCLIMDRIKKDAAMLQGDCFQNKEIQKKSRAAPVLSRAQLKSSSEKRGRGRPSKKFVSLAPKVKLKTTKFRATGPLLISKCLFSSKQKAVKDVTLSTKQMHGASVSKRRGTPPMKRVEHLGSTPNGQKSVETSLIESEFGKKFGRLLKTSVASDSAISSNQKESPTAACIKIPRKVGRPKKNPSSAVVHVPLKNSTTVSDIPRKPRRPCKNARPTDAVISEKNTIEPQQCNEVKRPVGRPLGSRTVGKNSLHVKRKVGRPRTRPIRLEYMPRKQELPCKSHDVNDSPIECLHPKSPIKTPTRKRGRPRKNPVEEIRPKYPSVPLPITDNFLFGGFGFQPSTFDGFAGTPSSDFSLPIEGAVLAVETVEEMPLLESVFSKNGEEINADSDFVPGSEVDASKESVVSQLSEVNQNNMTGEQWRLEQSQRDEEPPELSCCISVTTEPLLPPPPSISIGLDATSLPDHSRSQSSDEAINLPATDVLNLFMSPPEEERTVPDIHQLLTEMA